MCSKNLNKTLYQAHYVDENDSLIGGIQFDEAETDEDFLIAAFNQRPNHTHLIVLFKNDETFMNILFPLLRHAQD